MQKDSQVKTGSCLCEGVRYRVVGELRDVVNCFCDQCRKTSGHHVAATAANLEGFELTSDGTLSWYPSSDKAKRGFCNRCGSSLFWRKEGRDTISIFAGTLDKPTGLRTTENIYTESMSDYHELPPIE